MTDHIILILLHCGLALYHRATRESPNGILLLLLLLSHFSCVRLCATP